MTNYADVSQLVNGQQADATDVKTPIEDLDTALYDISTGAESITPDIDGGTIDNTVIGASVPTGATFDQVTINSVGTQALKLNQTDSYTIALLTVESKINAFHQAIINLRRARGANLPLNNGDQIGTIRFSAFDGVDYHSVANIIAIADENHGVSPDKFGTRLDFQVTPANTGVAATVLKMDGSKLYPATANAFSLGSSSKPFQNIYSQNSLVVTSDETAKENITNLSASLTTNILRNLRARTYRFKDDAEQIIHFGLVAQELNQSLKDAGIEPTDYALIQTPTPEEQSDGIKMGIRYGELIPVLVKALQEQSQEIQAIIQQNINQAQRLNILETQVAALLS